MSGVNEKKFSIQNENPYKNILIYHIGCVIFKGLSDATTNRINSLYLVINKINWSIEENNVNKYLTLVPIDQSKDTLKSMK